MTFQPGERVQLASGGLPWTVESVEGDLVTCIREAKKVERETFLAATLRPYVPPRPIFIAGV